MDGEKQPSASSGSSYTVASILRRIYDIDVQPAIDSMTTTASSRYPSISSIPRTSEIRLAQPDARPSLDPFPVEPIPATSLPPPRTDHAPNTILYLAYGSNLASSTFLGRRGIRPVSQVNVMAPSLELVFDLPGMPYNEPCFANTALRKIPAPPKRPPEIPKLPPEVPKLPPEVPELPDPPQIKPPRGLVPPAAIDMDRAGEGGGAQKTSTGDPVWTKGLIGVVYEVTASDFAKILATEGGGASYNDILVPVLALPPNASIPEHPPLPELPRPFLAHTLYAPALPEKPGDDDDGDGNTAREGDGGDGDKDKLPGWLVKWLAKFLVPRRRPDPNYAQPSGRYLGLLREGAREHDLPGEYQEWLAALSEYRTTSTRQEIGKLLFSVIVVPAFALIMAASKLVVDEKGRVPWWMGVVMGIWFRLVWGMYDVLFKPLFGDGERTQEEVERKERKKGKSSAGLRWRRERSAVVDEEKRCLMEWSE